MVTNKMGLDDLLVHYVGDFGRYQLIQFTLLILPCVYISMQSVSWTFTGAMLEHRCRTSHFQTGQNASISVLNFNPTDHFDSSDSADDGNASKMSNADTELLQCYRPFNTSTPVPPQRGFTNAHDNGGHPFAANDDVMMSPPIYEPCDSWVYDNSEITYSAVDRWDIVCERKFWRATVQSMYYVGQALGSVGFGWVGDRFGRKSAFVIASWLLCFSSILMAVVPWIELFAVLRLITGLAHPGIFVVAVIMGMELLGPTKRAAGSIAANLAFSMGQIGLAFFAYMLRDYQHLQLALSVPCLLFLGYYWVMPGSIRWLIAQKRFTEAGTILRRVAKINRRGELPPDWYEALDSYCPESTEKQDSTSPQSLTFGRENLRNNGINRFGVLDLFRTPQIRKHVLIQFFCWPTVSMVYYGISMDPSFLGGDRYVTFLLSALIEIPGVFFAAFMINRIGRKALMMVSMGVAGLFMTLAAVVPSPHPWFLIGCVILAKAAITSAYTTIYAWAPELFPTVIRNLATGCCSTMARIGGVSASYLVMLAADDNRTLVALLFGLCSLVAMVLSILEPETMNSKTIETIEEAEKFGATARTFSFKAPLLANSSEYKYYPAGKGNEGIIDQIGNGESCVKLMSTGDAQ